MILGRRDRQRVRELENDLNSLISAVAMTPLRFGDDSEARYERGQRTIREEQTRSLMQTYDRIVLRRLGYDPKSGPGEWEKSFLSAYLKGATV